MKIQLMPLFLIVFLAGQATAEEPLVVKNQKEKLSYAIGIDMGRAFKRESVDLDPDILTRGMKDGLSGEKALMADQEIEEILTAHKKEMMAKKAAVMKELGEKNKKEGEDFLAENKKKEGVVTLPSGLEYKVIKAGEGKKPKATDIAIAHYRGTFINGIEFADSYSRGTPGSFAVNRLLPGLAEVFQLMQEGAKWRVFIPSNLAYGERGDSEGKIGPNATLIFEIELISVQERK
jgi:FKBP-type peptidyl-prolyl cis-trans isomerase